LTTVKRPLKRREIRVCLIAFGVLILPGLVRGQTVEVPTLSLDGAWAVLHAAEKKAQQLTAPSSLAVVSPAGHLILFEQIQGARPIGIDLAIGKVRSAALFQESTQALEATINGARPAAITAARIQMQSGVPIHADCAVVGAVGVSGFDKAKDVEISEAAATAVNSKDD
jgi:glc operon protein GlcG